MIEQPQLFDRIEAQELRDKGMNLAIGADRVAIWKGKAESWISNKPTGFIFTSDDLTYAIGVPDEGQNRNNVVGAWFVRWAKLAKIAGTGNYVKGKRVSCHGAILKEWRIT